VIGVSVGAMFITQDAGLVVAALSSLRFDPLPSNPQMVGAPPQFKVTKATIEFLQKLQKDGKNIEVTPYHPRFCAPTAKFLELSCS
jgi:hypothetical protein